MTESQQLLADVAERGSETAFRELVTRYVDLVYSTAFRVVDGDAHRAEDVAQTVFLDLWRESPKISMSVMLGGWLHRHTCFVASNVMRGERRRQDREREAAEMNLLNQSDTGVAHLTPVLDEAINELGEEDRKAILLRFYERMDLRSVGKALGITENAAQKRVSRALGQLESILTHQGVTTSTVAIGVALVAEAVKAAPLGLAASITAATLSGNAFAAATAATATKTIAMTTLQKTIISSVVVAALSAGIYQTRRAANARAEAQTVRREFAEKFQQLSIAGDEATRQLAALRDENDRLKSDTAEVGGLRRQVTVLRQRLAEMSRKPASAKEENSTAMQTVATVTEAEINEFLQRTPTEQGKFLGAMRGRTHSGDVSTSELEHSRTLADKVRPNLEQLESRPADFADFQTTFIQTAIGVQDHGRMGQVHDIIQGVYEQAVTEHLDALSRPQGDATDWAVRRDALDREATRRVQQLLTPEERERFDRLFLGVMGIDLGIGDGAGHRFMRDDGTVVFPSEQPQPNKQQ